MELALEHAARLIKDNAFNRLADFIAGLNQAHMARHIGMAITVEQISPVQRGRTALTLNAELGFKPRERAAKAEHKLIKARAVFLAHARRRHAQRVFRVVLYHYAGQLCICREARLQSKISKAALLPAVMFNHGQACAIFEGQRNAGMAARKLGENHRL